MVLLEAVRDQDPVVIPVPLFWMVMVPGLLVLVQDDRPVLIKLTGTVYPHVTVGPCRPPVPDDIDRCFVGLVDRIGELDIFQPVIQRLRVPV